MNHRQHFNLKSKVKWSVFQGKKNFQNLKFKPSHSKSKTINLQGVEQFLQQGPLVLHLILSEFWNSLYNHLVDLTKQLDLNQMEELYFDDFVADKSY